MPGIRKSRGGWSDPSVIRDSFESEETEIFYCEVCQGERNRLYPRANYNESDSDQWLQCRICGDIKHINELIHSSKLESFAVPSDNPYEHKDLIIGLGNKDKLTPRQKELRRFKQELDKIQDKDERDDRKNIGLVRFVSDSLSNY